MVITVDIPTFEGSFFIWFKLILKKA